MHTHMYICTLQAQVHGLLQHARGTAAELDLVREIVLLLLELARGPTSIQRALEVSQSVCVRECEYV